MVTRTDPAREIADICKKLAKGSDKPGDHHMAAVFGVPPWSRDFYEIIFSIIDRTELLIRVTDELDLDDDQRSEIVGHIRRIQAVFSRTAMIKGWNSGSEGGLVILNGPHVAALSVLSGQVRAKISYPKLDDAEIADVLGLVDQLLTWLEDHQLSEQDFIRQALIDGLKTFRTRLERTGWLGWGYTIDSLRDVISAYMAIERGFPDPRANPNAAAILKKTRDLLEAVWEKTGRARDAKDNVDFLMQAYGWWAAARDTGIAGLLMPR